MIDRVHIVLLSLLIYFFGIVLSLLAICLLKSDRFFFVSGISQSTLLISLFLLVTSLFFSLRKCIYFFVRWLYFFFPCS
jgi:hypothetical protein